ncbi:MAG: hypothetical protein RI973_1740 [Bacteroidota bacterium]|jgi:hypothetical protein
MVPSEKFLKSAMAFETTSFTSSKLIKIHLKTGVAAIIADGRMKSERYSGSEHPHTSRGVKK